MEAIRGGFGAYFVTANDLVNDLGKSGAGKASSISECAQYTRPKVLIVDEVGYLPLDPIGYATIFFQLVSARYERGSIIADLQQELHHDWGAVFGDQTDCGGHSGQAAALRTDHD